MICPLMYLIIDARFSPSPSILDRTLLQTDLSIFNLHMKAHYAEVVHDASHRTMSKTTISDGKSAAGRNSVVANNGMDDDVRAPFNRPHSFNTIIS